MNMKTQFEKLFNNEMSTEEARTFLIDLYEKGESGADIAAAASVMREHSIKIPLPDGLREKAIDIVGTVETKVEALTFQLQCHCFWLLWAVLWLNMVIEALPQTQVQQMYLKPLGSIWI